MAPVSMNFGPQNCGAVPRTCVQEQGAARMIEDYYDFQRVLIFEQSVTDADRDRGHHPPTADYRPRRVVKEDRTDVVPDQLLFDVPDQLSLAARSSRRRKGCGGCRERCRAPSSVKFALRAAATKP
jgi:hypothetical protein